MAKVVVRFLPALLALASSAVAAGLTWRAWQGNDGVGKLLWLAETDPENETRYWRQALAQRPRTWEALVGLALEAESQGDRAEARRLLDRAVAVNRTFRTQWARLNFLARTVQDTVQDTAQNTAQEADFWPAARQTFAMSHRDRRALFELCWRMRPDGSFLLREVIGNRPPVLLDATQFLMEKDLPAARLAYARLLEAPYLSVAETNAGRVATAEERRGVGLDLCDLDLHHGHRREAWATWQGMRRRNLLTATSGRGFDWRPETRPETRPEKGMTGLEATPAGPHWVVSLSGDQAAGAVALWRPAPPAPEELGSFQPPDGLSMVREGDRILLRADRSRRVVTVGGQ